MNLPDLRQLRYFVAVAEELNFTRAAERLGIAQPPLTIQIQKLERLLGCTLLIRGRRTRLTAAGARLAEEARRVLEQAERAVEATRRTARGQEGELRVGVPPSVMLTRLPAAVRQFRARHPGVAFTLREMATSAIEQALQTGQIDLGFLRETRPPAPLHSELFLAEPLVAVLPATHPLAKAQKLKPRALAKEPFVFFPRRVGPAFYDAIMADCAAAGFVPQVVQEATQWPTLVALVEAGLGVTVAPGCIRKFRWPGVALRRIPGWKTRVFLGWHAAPSPAALAFRALAADLGARDRSGLP
jgi:DNA-binding transcriptional LysR family regulator